MTRLSTTTILLSAAVLAVTSLSPSVSAWEPGSGGRVMWESNCDFRGGDLSSTGVDAPSERCGDLCFANSQCSHWAWITNSRGGTCWLKGGTTATKTAAAGLGCGYVIGRFDPNGNGGGGGGGGSGGNNGLSPIDTQSMLNSINALRANNGLRPLTIESRLERAATAHSNDQANRCTMGHTGGDGSGAGDRVTRQGYRWGYVAENAAAGQQTVQDVMTSWANSPGHRRNLLSSEIVHVGFARATNNNCGNYKVYWTQVFARPL